MRIYQIGKNWFSESHGGGSDRVFTALSEHLRDSGDMLHSLVVGNGPQVAAQDVGDGVASSLVVGVSSNDAKLVHRWAALRKHALRTVKSFRPDVITSHFALYALPVLDVIGAHPFVVHFHGPWAQESAMEGESTMKVRLKARMERLVYSRGHRFIVLSPAFRNVLTEQYGVNTDRIHIVPGGVDVAAYDTGLSRSAARKRLGWPTDRPTLLSVRRLVKRVGLEGLIAAMRDVRRTVPDVLLMIAGKGPLRSTLEDMIEDYDLASHVRLLGFVPETDLAATYRAADLSVMPTTALEGFGLSAVESLAAGTPVMATPVGGLPSILSDLSPNLLFERADPDAFPERIISALDGSLSLPSDEACQTYAADRFDWPVIARQTRKVYQVASDC
jgi:glycosyltransferase involved in cell wall biosynthesis